MRRAHAAVQCVDGVGDNHYLQSGYRAFAGDQRLGQLRAQGSQRWGRIGTGEIIEQKHVQHDRALRLSDQAQDFVEYLLFAVAYACSVGVGDVGQQRDVLRRSKPVWLAYAGGQRLENLPAGHRHAADQEQDEEPT